MSAPNPKPRVARVHRANVHERARAGMLRLDMNEGVPGLPEDFVREVLAEVDSTRLATYPEYGSLESKIAAHDAVGRDMVVLSNGSDGAIKYTFDAYVSEGDRVLVTDPTFAMYPVYGEMFGAAVAQVPYREDLAFPFEEFAETLSDGVRLAVLVNPNNPTGSVIAQDRIEELAGRAADVGALLLVDEAYHYFYPETSAPLVSRFDNVIVTRTFSKLCGLAALRCGYALASPDVAQALRAVRPTYDVNGLAALFAERIIERPELMAELMAATAGGKAHLVERLTALGVPHVAGHANFVLIDCGSDAGEVAAALQEEGILVASGFRHRALARHIRVTVGDVAAMTRFEHAFERVRSARS